MSTQSEFHIRILVKIETAYPEISQFLFQIPFIVNQITISHLYNFENRFTIFKNFISELGITAMPIKSELYIYIL